MKLPRNLPRGRGLQPYSRADAPYFRSPGFFVRIGGLAVVVAVALALLLLRVWSIQVLHGPQYSAQAHSQAFRTVDLRGTRGAIVDRNGKLLAGMTARLVVAADTATLGGADAHGIWSPTSDGRAALEQFAKVSGTPVKTLVERIRRSVVRSPFAPAVVLPRPRSDSHRLPRRSGRSPSPASRCSPSPRARTRRARSAASSSDCSARSARRSSARRATRTRRRARSSARPGSRSSTTPSSTPGFVPAKVRVDSLGRITGPLEVPKQHEPPTLRLTIDSRLQKAAEKAVRDGIALAQRNGQHPTGGSAVAIDPNTGAILAIASQPNFNQVRAANDPGYLTSLYGNTSQTPTLNRAIAGVYPTGSTFKPIIAEAALSAGLITPDTPQLCTGSFNLGSFVFNNVERGIYESMTLHTALAQSCDTWFYRLGDRIWQADPARKGTLIQQWSRKFGLGAPTGVDLSGEEAGTVPSPAWFLRTNHYPWTEGQTINLSIGQGALQASPLQMAVAYSALVNGGRIVRPHVGDAVIKDGVRAESAFPAGAAAEARRHRRDPRRGCTRRPTTRPARPRPSSATSRSRSPARPAPRRHARPATTTPGTPPGPRTRTRSSSSSR